MDAALLFGLGCASLRWRPFLSTDGSQVVVRSGHGAFYMVV